jgi:TetR/AcrR family transcriptional repressor of bet genes
MSEPEPGPRFRRYASEVRAAMLVEAGLSVLAEGGITAFTVDNICKRAETSRGLIAHHFGGKEGLLVAVYHAAYAPLLADLTPDLSVDQVLDRLFSPKHFTRESLNIWLSLWGQVAVNAGLQEAHRANYAAFRAAVAHAIARDAKAPVDAEAIAAALIALADGLWLELCFAPDLMSPDRAKATCRMLLEPLLKAR